MSDEPKTTELLVAILGELREIRRHLGGRDGVVAEVVPVSPSGPRPLRAAAAVEIAQRGLARRKMHYD